MAFIVDAYREEEGRGEAGAPEAGPAPLRRFKVAVLPLSATRKWCRRRVRCGGCCPALHDVVSDDAQSIVFGGNRFVEANEVGTPFSVTVDFDTLAADGLSANEIRWTRCGYRWRGWWRRCVSDGQLLAGIYLHRFAAAPTIFFPPTQFRLVQTLVHILFAGLATC